MTKCSVKKCKNNTRNVLKKDGISYFSFPRNAIRCSEWRSIIARDRKEQFFKPKKGSVVCSEHFRPTEIYTTTKGFRRLAKHAKPTLKVSDDQYGDHESSPYDDQTYKTLSILNMSENQSGNDKNSHQDADDDEDDQTSITPPTIQGVYQDLPAEMSKKEKEVILNMLAIYKDMPQLWDKSHKDYKNKKIREEGYQVLLEIFNRFDPDATMRQLKKKIENLRTNYLKEVKKVIASRNKGEFYVPTLWYYDALSFLGTPPATAEACRTVADAADHITPAADFIKYEQDISVTFEEERSYAESCSEVSIPIKKRKTSLEKQDDELNTTEKPIHQCMCSTKENEWEVYGKSIGLQLRDLNNKELTIAQKLIADVIYYAKIGKLNEDAQVVLLS